MRFPSICTNEVFISKQLLFSNYSFSIIIFDESTITFQTLEHCSKLIIMVVIICKGEQSSTIMYILFWMWLKCAKFPVEKSDFATDLLIVCFFFFLICHRRIWLEDFSIEIHIYSKGCLFFMKAFEQALLNALLFFLICPKQNCSKFKQNKKLPRESSHGEKFTTSPKPATYGLPTNQIKTNGKIMNLFIFTTQKTNYVLS